ncbi:MAG TPA: hypothetical protein VJ063_02575 [Verrucomicrobiae bacterium]|nr:hypothetical protein [Verrucomicrobiae bacterium]
MRSRLVGDFGLYSTVYFRVLRGIGLTSALGTVGDSKALSLAPNSNGRNRSVWG